jgi:hypothetical protein
MDVSRLGPIHGLGSPAPAPRAGRAAPAAAPFRIPEPRPDVADVSATPPPEAAAELARTIDAPGRLAAAGRELHYDLDDAGTVRIYVRDLAGHVLREVPPSEAIDLATGDRPPR